MSEPSTSNLGPDPVPIPALEAKIDALTAQMSQLVSVLAASQPRQVEVQPEMTGERDDEMEEMVEWMWQKDDVRGLGGCPVCFSYFLCLSYIFPHLISFYSSFSMIFPYFITNFPFYHICAC